MPMKYLILFFFIMTYSSLSFGLGGTSGVGKKCQKESDCIGVNYCINNICSMKECSKRDNCNDSCGNKTGLSYDKNKCLRKITFENNCKNSGDGGKVSSCNTKHKIKTNQSSIINGNGKCVPFGYEKTYQEGSISQSGYKNGLKCVCKVGSLKNGKCPKRCPSDGAWKKAKRLLLERSKGLKLAILKANYSKSKSLLRNNSKKKYLDKNNVVTWLKKLEWSHTVIGRMIKTVNEGCED